MAVVEDEVAAVYRRFIDAQNRRDAAALTPLLRNGDDFLWVTTSAVTVWGRDAALDRFRKNWERQWHLDPAWDQLRIVELSPGTALLHVPLRFTFAPLGEPAAPTLIKWSGVFVREANGWVVAAILLATVP